MLMKKIGCAVLSVVLVILCLTVPALAETDIKLTDEVYPTEIIEGNPFSVYGIVTSENNISAVTIGVYNTKGNAEFEYTGKPGEKTYNIHNIDYLLTFSKLKAGNYVYKIVATDTKTSNVVLLEKEFKVLSKDTFNTFKLSDASYPTELKEGQTFSIKGTVTSEYTISAVTCSVRSKSGTLQFTKTTNPGTQSYSVTGLDNYMTFSKLKPGEYVYKITASDKYNKDVVLLEKSFVVKAVVNIEDSYDGVRWDVIDLSVWNEINSWKKIANSVDAVILRIGSSSTASKAMSEDKKFSKSYASAKDQGIPVGCYYFSAATTTAEARKEANLVLEILKKYNCKLEMPVYYDMETDAQVRLSQSAATAVAKAFCETIEKGGFYCGIYCNKFFARDELHANQLSDYHFWIAQYANKCTYEGPYGMWQYSETGSVPGISGDVDLDYCYFDYPNIIKSLGMSGYSKPVEKPTVNPSFKFNEVDDFAINSAKTIIYGIEARMTTEEFTEKYITLRDGATIEYDVTVGGCIATGTEVRIMGNGVPLAEYVISVKRDTDMNSIINSSDALLVLQYAVGMKSLGPARRLSADITGDGKINSSDALEILTYAVS